MPHELCNLAVTLVPMLDSSAGHSRLYLLCCHQSSPNSTASCLQLLMRWWPLVTCRIVFYHLKLAPKAFSAPVPACRPCLLTDPSWRAALPLGVSTLPAIHPLTWAYTLPSTRVPLTAPQPLRPCCSAQMRSHLHHEPPLSSDSLPWDTFCVVALHPQLGGAWILEGIAC